MDFDISMTDDLLATTRAVRKRLDLTKPVPRELIDECLELAIQAPTGSNSQTWRWLVVDDAEQRKALADLYRRGAEGYLTEAGSQADETGDAQTKRVFSSALYLMEHLHEVPVQARRSSASRYGIRFIRLDLSSGMEFPAGSPRPRLRHRVDHPAFVA